MTIGELIEALRQFQPDTMVVVRGYEGGYDNPQIRKVQLAVDDNASGEANQDQGGQVGKITWYYGIHGDGSSGEPTPTKAICL